MARLNQRTMPITTHEGSTAKHINYEQQLRRSVMSCMLWESEFYEDGQEIGKRIQDLVSKVDDYKVSQIAIEAREVSKLRHVPLLLAVSLARKRSKFTAYTLERIIQRPDELNEFLAIYWKDGKVPLSAQVKKGLAKAFTKFNEYQLGKYNNQDKAIKLRDVLFLCHAKPINAEQDALWKRLINGQLLIPDTWETSLSSGQDKKETFMRLISENKLGALAFLRNLRNMLEAKIEVDFIRQGLLKMNPERVLPFRFISASKYAPILEPELEQTMFKCLEDADKMQGKTILLVDVSKSMDSSISSKSDLQRLDAGCGLAMLLREVASDLRIFTFSKSLVEVPLRRGFALKDAVIKSQPHSSTYLGQAVTELNKLQYDRIIVITDEQSSDHVPNPKGNGYVINIASAKNGVGYGAWNHIDGWSESVIKYIQESENEFKKDK